MINMIAASSVGFLSIYFAKAGEAAAKKIGEDIYQTLKKHFNNKPAAKEASVDLEDSPNNPDYQAALRVQLKKLLTEDEELVKELQQILSQAEKTEAGSVVIQQTAGDNAKQFGQVFGDVNF